MLCINWQNPVIDIIIWVTSMRAFKFNVNITLCVFFTEFATSEVSIEMSSVEAVRFGWALVSNSPANFQALSKLVCKLINTLDR